MRASRVTEEQIIGKLKEQRVGAKTAEVCRKHGISAATFYKFKAKFGGMDVSEAGRLKVLEDENARLKKLLAEQMLDVTPDAKRKTVAHACDGASRPTSNSATSRRASLPRTPSWRASMGASGTNTSTTRCSRR
jgi:putative transposase